MTFETAALVSIIAISHLRIRHTTGKVKQAYQVLIKFGVIFMSLHKSTSILSPK